MVESLTTEEEWAEHLRHIPDWDVPDQPILLIAPHPDDETLGAGGLIAAARARDIPVRVVAVTDGENAYPENTQDQVNALRALRIIEQTNALQRLAVDHKDIVRLALPDSAVETRQQELIERLSALVTKDTHIIAPWQSDFHPDHRTCGQAAKEVASQTGVRLTSYFFWTWHQGSPVEMRDLSLRSFRLSPALVEAKAEALLCHRSQLYRESGDPILPEHLLAPARRAFETFLVG